MNDYHEPELQEAFKALTEEFPRNGNQMTTPHIILTVPEGVTITHLVDLGWISQRSECLEVYYVPSGQLLETIKTNNPGFGALSKGK
jgi:hypothetical protein